MEVKLVQTENDLDFKKFKLCSEIGGGKLDVITSFDVEINNETALISYDTKEKYRHQGYASKGLKMLSDTLFSDDNILFLELIHLSGDYSRKVAENAGFFSCSGNLEYWVSLNPYFEQILRDKLSSLDASYTKYKKVCRLLEKAETLRKVESKAKEKMQEKLDSLLQQKELVDDESYKNELELSHLQNILEPKEVKKL